MINEKKDFSMFLNYNDNTGKVVFLFMFIVLFLKIDFQIFFKYIIKAFIQIFIKESTRIIRNKFKLDTIFDRIEITQKREITIKQLNALKES